MWLIISREFYGISFIFMQLLNMPPEMLQVFKSAGVKKSELKNPETARMIYETMQDSMQVSVIYLIYRVSSAPIYWVATILSLF